MFLGGAIEKLKVDPEIEQFYEFKNAADVYKRKGYSDRPRPRDDRAGEQRLDAIRSPTSPPTGR